VEPRYFDEATDPLVAGPVAENFGKGQLMEQPVMFTMSTDSHLCLGSALDFPADVCMTF
jgi:hypothetical protein